MLLVQKLIDFVLGYHALSPTTTHSKLASQGCWIAFIGSLHVENFISQCSQPPEVDQHQLHPSLWPIEQPYSTPWICEHSIPAIIPFLVYNTFSTDIARQYHSSCSWTFIRFGVCSVSITIILCPPIYIKISNSYWIVRNIRGPFFLGVLSLSTIKYMCTLPTATNRRGGKGPVVNSLCASL